MRFVAGRRLRVGAALAVVIASAAHRAAAEPARCAIVIGGGGKSHRYDARLAPGQSARFDGVPASDFIRSTSGPCVFVVYNNAGFGGRSVRLGTGLDDRIRAGLDGVTRRDGGGGETWRIRSVRMERMDTACRLRLGGDGVRMTYFAGLHPEVPAMDRIGELVGDDCMADIWNGTDFGAHDPDNRFKSLHASGPRSEAYDPGFRVRSFQVMAGGANCPAFARDQGRCLPQTLLDRRLHTESGPHDRDRDGLDDEMENRLATAFRPIPADRSRGRRSARPVLVRTPRPGRGPAGHVLGGGGPVPARPAFRRRVGCERHGHAHGHLLLQGQAPRVRRRRVVRPDRPELHQHQGAYQRPRPPAPAAVAPARGQPALSRGPRRPVRLHQRRYRRAPLLRRSRALRLSGPARSGKLFYSRKAQPVCRIFGCCESITCQQIE